MEVNYLLLSVLIVSVVTQIHPKEDYNDHFNCIQDHTTKAWTCCGYNALGERHCAPEGEWNKYENKYRRCVKEFGTNKTYKQPSELTDKDIDMCCDAFFTDGTGKEYPLFAPNCGVCKQFYVWDFADVDAMVAKSSLSQEWRTEFVNQNLSDNDGYDNQVFPGGFQKATLREFNDPNVCIYVPYAAAKVIEVKVESDEFGDRLCIGDVHDESTDRNDPGQNDACGRTQVSTCFGDANIVNPEYDAETVKQWGYAFYVFCDEACKEGGGSGDVPLWVRARYSPETWLKGTYNAENNVEMWCDYVVRDYPEWDVYPSDVSLLVDPIIQPDEEASTFLGIALLFGVLLLNL